MLPMTLAPSPETMAFLMAMADDEAEYQAAIMQAREYDAGQQFVALTERLREFLGGDTDDTSQDYNRLRLNVCRIVLSAVVERLMVSGFDSDETPQREAVTDERGEVTERLVKPVAAWAWRTWQRNRMDAKQRRVHEMALRDSEAFVIVDWDNTAARPRFTPHQRFVDATMDGDGDGCRAFYRNDDPDQDLLFVAKRWTEVVWSGASRQRRQRLTLYYPGQIEKYTGWPGAWQPVSDAEGEPWPIPWTDATGRPLGIPVAHFRSSAGMEAREAWPLQNAINKALVDLMTESDMSAFRIMLAFGWKPVDGEGQPLAIEPGRWMGSENKEATAQAIPGSDLTAFLNLIDSLMFKVATVTDTPVSRFIVTKQVAAEGTQKEQGATLLNKARNRAGELGNGWEDAMSIARRLENTFGAGGLDEAAMLSVTWQPLESRDELAELAQAQARKDLGMPIRLVAKGLDLTQEDIALWESEAATRRETAQAAFGAQEEPDDTMPMQPVAPRNAP